MNSRVEHYRMYVRQNAQQAATTAVKAITQYPTQQIIVRVSTRGHSGRIWDMVRPTPQSANRRTYQPQHAILVQVSGCGTNPKSYKHAFLLIEHNETFVQIYVIEDTCIGVNIKFCLNTSQQLRV